MSLSTDLISQFVKITNDKPEPKTESTVYGTTVEYNGGMYVQFDGSELLTPVTTTSALKPGERVAVMIKNHAAMVTGNITSPSASDTDVKELGNKISEFEIVIADKVSTSELDAEKGRIDSLISDNASIRETLSANEAIIGDLTAADAEILGRVTANEAAIDDLDATKIDAEIADVKYATVENLEATDLKVYNLESTYGAFEELTTKNFATVNASIADLDANKLSVTEADLTYVNIDFSNIDQAWMDEFYTRSGLIENITIGQGVITGYLAGVTIKGDLIEGGTVKADKLIILGEDGLYYKLNTNGETVESEQTQYNSLDGSHILANSITATKIDVNDLVAFNATIGGFHITDSSIYSGVKSTVGNTTRGIYLDNDGQIAFGDSNEFVKFYKDEATNEYKLAISASNITIGSSKKSVETIADDAQTAIDAVNDIEGKFGGYYTKEETDSALSAKADEISSTVDSKIAEIEIGGRNLLKWTQDLRITETSGSDDGISKYMSNVGTLTKTDYGIKLTFDSSTNAALSIPLVYDGCIENGEEITLSFDYRGNITNPGSFYFMQRTTPNVSNNLTALATLTANETEWQHFSVTFANANANVRTNYRVLLFYNNLDYTPDNWIEIKAGSLKLESGNKETDWSPAPEDIDASIDNINTEIRQEITEQNISITQNCEGIIMEALTAYTKTSDFDAFNETVTAQLALLSDQISLKFTEQQQQITDMNESLQGQLNTITKYFTFDINGLTIGQQDNPYKVIIDNDRYSMTVNDVEVMWIANGKVYTPEIEVTSTFRLLDYLISKDSAGNVNCEYIGG